MAEAIIGVPVVTGTFYCIRQKGTRSFLVAVSVTLVGIQIRDCEQSRFQAQKSVAEKEANQVNLGNWVLSVRLCMRSSPWIFE